MFSKVEQLKKLWYSYIGNSIKLLEGVRGRFELMRREFQDVGENVRYKRMCIVCVIFIVRKRGNIYF